MGRQRDRRPWPYSVGTRGINRVRVYSRSDSKVCQIEWFDDDGRHQQSLRTFFGDPIEDTPEGRSLARDIAEDLSREQGAKHAAYTRAKFEKSHDLEYLLTQLHEHRGPTWSEKYRKDQERYRDFWLDLVGRTVMCTQVHRLPLRALIEAEADKRGWKTERTKQAYLRYLVDAFIFARDTLKIIDTRHDLSGVDLPSPAKKGPSYTEDEIAELLPALWERDPRAGLVGEAYFQAGRRKNATRTLRAEDVRFAKVELRSGTVMAAVLRYRAKSDKVGRDSEAVLVDDAVAKILDLLDQPAVEASGFLLPAGELDDPDPDRKPIRPETLNQMLHDAEEAAGIEHVKGRGYHGIKRRFGGMTAGNREGASAQSGTSVPTLRRYDPHDDIEAKAELALELKKRRAG